MGEDSDRLAPHAAMVQTRHVLTLIEGLGSRLHQTLSPRGAARSRPWRAVAAGCAAVDLIKADLLTRDDRLRLGSRLLLDAGDLALWCCAASDDYDTSEDSVIPGVALAAEAGARLGPHGLAVPVVNAAVAAAVRHHRGHRLRLEQFSWQVMGTLGGWMLATFARRRRTALEGEHHADLRARLQGAELAGIHDVVTVNEGAIDVLQRATALVDLGARGERRRRDLSGAFKADVADAARSSATYLRDALGVWQGRHNLDPDLRRAVHVELDGADGTILLTAAQVAILHAQLDELALTGAVRVEALDRPAAARPYGNRDLEVNGVLISLPGDAATRAWTFDAIPTAFLMTIGWLLQPMGRHREAVPFSATAAPLAMTVGATGWAARHADRHGAVSPRAALGWSFATTLSYTVVATTSMGNPQTEQHISRFPWTLALQGYELIRSIVASDLSPAGRRLAVAGTAVIIGTGWALTPTPRSGRALAAELQWVVGTVVGARELRLTIGRQGEALVRAIGEDDERAIADAYRRGRARAGATIKAAVESARVTLADASLDLDPDLRAEAHRRLGTAEHLLARA